MCFLIKHTVLAVLWLLQICFALTVRSYVFQKDMSEHCRRRVVPSVFLGRHVVDAHSQNLHFSRMELPYSCFISVRGESGSNIILVVQLLSDESLLAACSESPDQLLVYEMGETFGGYWGPLPDSLMRQKWSATNSYILKATPQKTTTTKPSTTTMATEVTKNVTIPVESGETQDYIRMEIPIVNFSGSIDSKDMDKPYYFNMDEAFDLLYDVMPNPNVKYNTRIMPLVQFSANKQNGGRREGEGQYELQLNADLPMQDPRLTFPPYKENYEQTMTKIKVTPNNIYKKKLNLKKNHSSTKPKDKPIFYESFFNKVPTKNTVETTYKNFPEIITDHFSKQTEINRESAKSWRDIEDILKMYNNSNVEMNKPINENLNLLHGISNKQFNYSAYLSNDSESLVNFSKSYSTFMPTINNFGTFTRKPLPQYTYTTRHIRQFLKSSLNDQDALAPTVHSVKESNLKSVEDIKKTFESYLKASSHDVIRNNDVNTVSDRILEKNSGSTIRAKKEKVPNSNVKMPLPTLSAPLTGSLVGHESWENLVQAAPVMAVLLNHSVPNGKNVTAARKKRTIKPISIENARPRQRLTKNINVVTTTTYDYGVSDMQEFAQLVELQDDELHERVALRYLRQYVGPVLFNICDFTEPKARYVLLFNSSRIVLSLTNFTLARMAILLTPAHTLLSSTAKCVPSSLECQVYGTRVCIDSMNACDGQPNCGAYDIYDEDRLMCGAAVGLQHNVYLAAITFLAVLLTMLYTVHYWLKRCVPKVSEAFFLYTDRAENILYLESIMRSPYDMDDASNKGIYHESLFDDEEILYAASHDKYHRNVFYKAFQRCLAIFTCKFRNKHASGVDRGTLSNPNKKTYSFAELELRRMSRYAGVDEGVQTGSSLEIKEVNKMIAPFLKRLSSEESDYEPKRRISKQSDDIQVYVNELNMLKFLKHSRTNSLLSSSNDPTLLSIQSVRRSAAEEEIKNHIYDNIVGQPLKAQDLGGSDHIHTEAPGPSMQRKKRLRFEEETIMIPTSDNEDDEESAPNLFITERQKTKGLDTIDEDEPSTGNKDFKRFWGGSKSKKVKKKTHITLR